MLGLYNVGFYVLLDGHNGRVSHYRLFGVCSIPSQCEVRSLTAFCWSVQSLNFNEHTVLFSSEETKRRSLLKVRPESVASTSICAS